MLAERFGSYSTAATFAGTPVLSRRKSTLRWRRLWPPPRCHEVVRPRALRPPLLLTRPPTRDFSGCFAVTSAKSETLMLRRPAEVGL